MHRLPYLECYPNGRSGPQEADCVKNNIKSYPTWFVGGRRQTEILNPKQLAQMSRFPTRAYWEPKR